MASEELWGYTINRALFSAESEDNSNNVWNAAFNQGIGEFGNNNANNDNNNGARPDFYLKSDIEITGGDGTKGNPFIIKVNPV